MSKLKNILEFKINGKSYVAEFTQITDKDKLHEIKYMHDRGTDPTKINGYVRFKSPFFISDHFGKYNVMNDLEIEGNIEEYSRAQMLNLLFQTTQYRFCPLQYIMTGGGIHGTKHWLNEEIDDVDTTIKQIKKKN